MISNRIVICIHTLLAASVAQSLFESKPEDRNVNKTVLMYNVMMFEEDINSPKLEQ